VNQRLVFFATKLSHPVTHLRDVNWKEWKEFQNQMEERISKRSAHIIGENKRVIEGKEFLLQNHLNDFGKLMFESHESSFSYFQNSCKELDVLVQSAKEVPQVLGARLSGGGFGGSAVFLVHEKDVEFVKEAILRLYKEKTGVDCQYCVVLPSSGARIRKG